MDQATFLVFVVIPVAGFALAMAICWPAARHGRGWIAALVLLIGVAILLWAIWQENGNTSWSDRLMYFLVKLLGALPILVGGLIGSAIGWWRRARTEQRQ